MKVYVGQTRSTRLLAKLRELGFGEMTVRSEWPPRRAPWALDNGAFTDWKAKRPFDERTFLRVLDRMHEARDDAGPPDIPAPDFLVVPDIVAGGLNSLGFSLKWGERLRRRGWCGPLYLAVQDGMERADVVPYVHLFQGLFVGGTLRWKLKTAEEWIALARLRGLPCHIGRVGTAPRVRWARRIGASSIDSALPLWSAANLHRFIRALTHGQQELLFTTPRS